MEKELKIKLETASNIIPITAIVKDGEIVVKYMDKSEIEWPKSFRDLCKIYGYSVDSQAIITGKDEWYSGEDTKDIFITENYAKAVLALNQLLFLRQRVLEIEGYKAWEQDFFDHSFIITNESEKLVTNSDEGYINSIMSFPTSSICKKFLKTYKDLLEGAKMLL